MKNSINLYKFVSNEKIRPMMCGVFHDEATGYAVASDAQILVAWKGGYDAQHAGKVVYKDGSEATSGKYPDWQKVLPNKDAMSECYLDDFLKAAANAKNFCKNAPKKAHNWKVYRNVIVTTKVVNKDGETVWLSFKNDVAQKIAALPLFGAKVYFSDDRCAILIENEGAGMIALAMPIRISPGEVVEWKKALDNKGFYNSAGYHHNESVQGGYWFDVEHLGFPEFSGDTYLTSRIPEDIYLAAWIKGEPVASASKPDEKPVFYCISAGGVQDTPELTELRPTLWIRTIGDSGLVELYKKDKDYYISMGKAMLSALMCLPLDEIDNTPCFELIKSRGWSDAETIKAYREC